MAHLRSILVPALIALLGASLHACCSQTPAPTTEPAESPSPTGAGEKAEAPPADDASDPIVERDADDHVTGLRWRGHSFASKHIDPEGCERWNTAADPVEGATNRLTLVQLFCENGEDEFSRDIEAWVADKDGKVLWTGKGSFSNSFDECQTLDVPSARVEANTLIIVQTRGTTRVEGSTRCEPVPMTDTPLAKIPL